MCHSTVPQVRCCAYNARGAGAPALNLVYLLATGGTSDGWMFYTSLPNALAILGLAYPYCTLFCAKDQVRFLTSALRFPGFSQLRTMTWQIPAPSYGMPAFEGAWAYRVEGTIGQSSGRGKTLKHGWIHPCQVK